MAEFAVENVGSHLSMPCQDGKLMWTSPVRAGFCKKVHRLLAFNSSFLVQSPSFCSAKSVYLDWVRPALLRFRPVARVTGRPVPEVIHLLQHIR